MKIRIVLDTNVIISALLFGGNPRKILEYVLAEKIHLLLSPEILKETKGVLSRPKFKLKKSVLQSMVNEIEFLAEIIFPIEKFKVVKEDPDDDMLFDCALAGNSKYIISGNDHVVKVKIFNGVEVLSPAEFLSKVVKNL